MILSSSTSLLQDTILWDVTLHSNVLEQPTVSISNMKGSVTLPAEASLQTYMISNTTCP